MEIADTEEPGTLSDGAASTDVASKIIVLAVIRREKNMVFPP